MKIPATSQIIYLKGVINYSEFYLKDGSKKVFCQTLKNYETNHFKFLRVNKNYLVNPNFIKEVNLNSYDSEIVLLNGERLPLSRRKKVELREELFPFRNIG